MNCQQIYKISRKKKYLTEVKIFQKVLGGYFFETPCTVEELKLTTDRHVASRRLFATAELLG